MCGEVLGGLGGDDIIAKVADDFNFELNDSCTRGIVNDEINRENFNFDVANLGGLIDVPHDVDNPVVSTNNGYILPSNTRPNDSLVSIVGVDQFGFNKSLDYDGHSTLLNIPLVPKVTAAVFPAEAPKEDSAIFDICYECSELLGDKGMKCPQCKESYHLKCHVPPKYVAITAYYQKQGLKNWKCSTSKI